MTARLASLALVAAGLLLLAWAVGTWLDHSLSSALDGLGGGA